MSLPAVREGRGSQPLANPRHERFAQEYIVDLVAAAAYERAGYSAAGPHMRTNAVRLLAHAAVQERIAYLQAERATRLGVAQDRVVLELARIGFCDMRDFAEWGPSGVALRSSTELDPGAAACVSEISQTTSKHGVGVRFKLHDKTRALELLGRHLGMFKEPEQDEEPRPLKILVVRELDGVPVAERNAL